MKTTILQKNTVRNNVFCTVGAVGASEGEAIMDILYDEVYYQHYDMDGKQVNYMESEEIAVFFDKIANRIVTDLHPRTVLDAGCASGRLVAALRDRGVEAYGIDISEYAVSVAREDIRPFCVVGSLAEPLPGQLPDRYDLIVSLEVLEHLTESDGRKAIANLCAHTDQLLFCSTPDDFDDPTHINVQPAEYWAGFFAQEGFLHNLDYIPSYITSYAALFVRRDGWFSQMQSYERYIVESSNEIRAFWEKVAEDKERHIQNQNVQLDALQQKLSQKEQHIHALNLQLNQMKENLVTQEENIVQVQREKNQTDEELAYYKLHYHAAINQREELTCNLRQCKSDLEYHKSEWERYKSLYEAVIHSVSWNVTKPCRSIMYGVRKLRSLTQYSYLVKKGLQSFLKYGFRVTWQKTKYKIMQLNAIPQAQKKLYTEEELARQKTEKFPKEILFSILVPLYNTPDLYLCEMIQSVLDQTYGNWELCLADGSDDKHAGVGAIVKKYAKQDDRIRYVKLEKNLGISGNTNACIDMARGDYISLFDHDDLLHPAALYEVMKAICEQNADFIYTDENTFHKTPSDAYCPHFKPDYAPDTLRANNYICHFTSFKASLLDVVGKFRPECDGSQDFDMVLRLTEKAEKIVHIPKILYYWRSHPNSVASSIGAKPYVITAAKKAISDHLDRVGLKGEVLDSVVPSMYRLKYEIEGEPLVSILIPNYEHKAELKTCLESIYAKTTYRNFEIIIIENNSSGSDIFNYYEEIQKRWDNLKVITWDSHFNYSAINNFGARFASGTHLLLLNNDTEVISPDWIQEMLMYSQRPDVGAVGAKLYYPDNTIQHAGLGMGLLTLAGHLHRNFDRNHPGYMGRLIYAQNLSGVTAACVMIRKEVWDQVNGLDETFEVAFNDVDLCMRIRAAGYLIVWTPFAELYHYESKSRGSDEAPEKRKRFAGEVHRFQARWAKELAAGDPYYNPNLTLDKEDFSIRI